MNLEREGYLENGLKRKLVIIAKDYGFEYIEEGEKVKETLERLIR